jgi:hypothetical protein
MVVMAIPACLFLLVGCSGTVVGTDAWHSQPYIAGGEVADAEAIRTTGIPFRSVSDIRWHAPSGESRPTQGQRTARQIIRFLSEYGYSESFESVRSIGRPDDHDPDPDPSRSNPLSVSDATEVFPLTVVICAVDPVVVVIAPIEVASSYRGRAFNGYSIHDSSRPVDPNAIPVFGVGLVGGILYGRHVPLLPDLVWASPDLEIGPQAVHFENDGRGRIDVAWGTLWLVPTGDVYEIIAQTEHRQFGEE